MGGSALGSRREKPFDTGRKAAQELLDCLNSHSCVDTHVEDMLIIFMALAKGTSRIRCILPLTLHTQTAIHIAELITEVRMDSVNKSEF